MSAVDIGRMTLEHVRNVLHEARDAVRTALEYKVERVPPNTPLKAGESGGLRAREGDKQQESTKTAYRNRARVTLEIALMHNSEVWGPGIERSSTVGSWYAFRAAMLYELVKRIAQIADELEAAIVRAAQPGADAVQAVSNSIRAARTLQQMLGHLRSVPVGRPPRFAALTSGSPLIEDGKPRRRQSKSLSLRGLPPDWRERIADVMEEPLRLQWLVQCVSGCRSQELKNGVCVSLSDVGDIEVHVVGAKVRDRAGQPWRAFAVKAQGGVAWKLAEALMDSGPVTILLPGKVDTYRNAVVRKAALAFPGRIAKRKVTAYSARHQFKADLKAAGWARDAIALAMGHVTTRSATYYGRGGRAGGGSVKLVRVDAARPVKVRPLPPVRPKSPVNSAQTRRFR